MAIIIGGPWHTTATTPIVVGYPNTYTVPVGTELAPSDVDNNPPLSDTASSWLTFNTDMAGAVNQPGCYHYGISSRVQFANQGGDWFDATGASQGLTPFATISAVLSQSAYQTSSSLVSLVTQWCNGSLPNYGFMLHTSTNSTLNFYSRFNGTSTNRPILTVNGTDVPCSRSVRIVTTQIAGVGLGNNDTLSVDSINRTLLWFDLTAFNGLTITSATLSIFPSAWFGPTWPMTINIFRLWNPGDQSSMPQQLLGLAQNYPMSAGAEQGIETHPDVIFVQNFADVNYNNKWARNPKHDTFINAPDGNGFQLLGGSMNGVKCTITAPDNSAFECYYYARSLNLEECFVRGYIMFGDDWNPVDNPAGKLDGFDGRYLTPVAVPNMSAGNSGDACTGLGGWSSRMSYDDPHPANDPLAGCVGVGFGDNYNCESIATLGFGDTLWFANKYLTALRKSQWYCIEFHQKMNTVTQPAEVPRVVTALSQTGGVATVVLQNPEPNYPNNPLYQVGQVWSIGNAAFTASLNYDNEHTITNIIDAQTFQFSIAAGTQSPAVKRGISYDFLAVPGTGRKDGILEIWINGRFAGSYTNIRWRNSRLRPDGGIFGIDNIWFQVYAGGNQHPTAPNNCSCYRSGYVVARSYIGPMVLAQTAPVLPAWLQNQPMMQWIEIAGTGMDKMDYSSQIAAGLTTAALTIGGRVNPAVGPTLAITGISNQNPGIVTVDSTATLANGQSVLIGCDQMPLLNNTQVTVANKTGTTFEMQGVNTIGYGTFVSGRLQAQPTPGGASYYGDPITAIVQADSGLGFKSSNSTLLVYGGGGDGSWAGNDLRGLCLENDNPTWTTLKKPTDVSFVPKTGYNNQYPVANITTATNLNGTPVAGHSYFQNHFVNAQNKFYRMNFKQAWQRDTALDNVTVPNIDYTGVIAAGTIDTDAADTWDAPGTHPDNPQMATNGWDGAPGVGHPITDDFYVISFKGGVYRLMRYTWSANGGNGQWDQLGGVIANSGTNPGAGSVDIDPRASIDAYHGTAGMMLVLQTIPGGTFLQLYNLDTGLKTNGTLNPGPYTANIISGTPFYAAGMCFDLVNNYFAFYRDDRFIYTLTQDPGSTSFTVGQMSLTGTAPPLLSFARQSSNSTWVSMMGRTMCYVPHLKGIAMFPNQWAKSANKSANCYFVKTS